MIEGHPDSGSYYATLKLRRYRGYSASKGTPSQYPYNIDTGVLLAKAAQNLRSLRIVLETSVLLEPISDDVGSATLQNGLLMRGSWCSGRANDEGTPRTGLRLVPKTIQLER